MKLRVVSCIAIFFTLFLVGCGSSIPDDARPHVTTLTGDVRELSGLPVPEPETEP